MIQWVYEGCRTSTRLDRILIATDDERILSSARAFGADAVLTSSGHPSGTERAAEVARSLPHPIIINIQGDMPLVTGRMIDDLVDALQDDALPAATLAHPSTNARRFRDENAVKVVCDQSGRALYFSRVPIPHGGESSHLIHVGLYGFQKDFLLKIPDLPPSSLEDSEKLEQLKILDNGYTIKVIKTDLFPHHVDRPEDIGIIEKLITKRGT